MRRKRVNKSGSIKKASSEPTIIETPQYRKNHPIKLEAAVERKANLPGCIF
ncbi:hypothetical protein [Halobacillus campisalis]|uniref:Uncharacterized protein n=1 Tax=Halobacillus campisalis TaxID=435909 RepID=A0ABW2K9R3_9BACI|nr:hypothetical protein [Halobacillus campisalis]